MRMAASIVFEEHLRPLVVVRFVGGPSDEEFEAYLSRFDAMMADEQVYAIMFVTAPDAPMTRARHARRQAQWMAANVRNIRRHVVSIAFVLQSPLMRGVLRAVLAMQPVAVEYAVFRSEDDAIAWSRDMLSRDTRLPR